MGELPKSFQDQTAFLRGRSFLVRIYKFLLRFLSTNSPFFPKKSTSKCREIVVRYTCLKRAALRRRPLLEVRPDPPRPQPRHPKKRPPGSGWAGRIFGHEKKAGSSPALFSCPRLQINHDQRRRAYAPKEDPSFREPIYKKEPERTDHEKHHRCAAAAGFGVLRHYGGVYADSHQLYFAGQFTAFGQAVRQNRGIQHPHAGRPDDDHRRGHPAAAPGG